MGEICEILEHLTKEEKQVAQNVLENFEFFLNKGKLVILEIAASNKDIGDYNHLIKLSS